MTHDEERAACTGVTMGLIAGFLLSAVLAYVVVGVCLLIGAAPWPALAVGTTLLIIEIVLYVRNRADIRWTGRFAHEQLRQRERKNFQSECRNLGPSHGLKRN